jgi:DNA-binding Lrp family transcriptional regulator
MFFNVQSGREKDAVEYLRTLPQVIEAYVTYGVYDGLVKIEEKDEDVLKDFITSKIRRYTDENGENPIKSTMTMIIARQDK